MVPLDIALEIGDELMLCAGTPGVRHFRGITRQQRADVRRVQAEGVPALGPPRFSDAAPFKHLMIATLLLEEITDPKPGRARSYDNRVKYPRHDTSSQQNGIIGIEARRPRINVQADLLAVCSAAICLLLDRH
ncbi:hypothetical protein EFR01_50890 [Sinorhizobium fredii]|nr:hypothetical protein EFR01_50890 [Sinorhizobium fredii]GLS07418.1 hypothetical protein GCM10007864_10450 [Sinorhizobium fredii]